MTHGSDVEQYPLGVDRTSTSGLDWAHLGASVSGPLLTLATAIVLDLLNRQGFLVPNPFPILLLSVAFASLRGGLRSGIVSAVLVILYGLHFLSEAGRILQYSVENGRSLAMVALTSPAMAVLIARWRSRRDAAARDEAAAEAARTPAERRAESRVEAGALLASSVEYEVTLQSMARLIIPTFADWCLVHVVNPDGSFGYVASAHHDPGREALVHSVRRYLPRQLAEGRPMETPWLVSTSTDEALGEWAQDAEQRKLLEALGARSWIVAPLVARGRLLGTLTLVMADSARRFTSADLVDVEPLAGRAALAIDNARLHQQTQEAERRNRLLFEANPQPMWIFDIETLTFLAVNDAAVRHYGYSRDEFLAMTIMELRPDEDATPPLPTIDRHAPQREQVALTQHRRKDGSVVDVEISSHELTFEGARARLVQVTDVTDRTRTRVALHQSEEQLRKAQKMDAVGRLAEGVAHDFNNLLTAIQGYSEIMLRDFDPADPRRKDLEQIRRAADRGALLTRQLLAFGRREQFQPKPMEINAVVSTMEPLLHRLVGADIRLATVLAPNLGRVWMDPAQLEQVLMNLVLGARDAMPGGGTLTIETGERYVGNAVRGRRIKPGRYVVLTVADSGVDDEADAPDTTLDPFRVAKEQTGGAGFGLSIVYGIVRQHGGVVRVATEAGSGTTVRIYLPRLEDQEAGVGATELEPSALRGMETVLLVEDEEAVRELLRKVLLRQGYSVLEARHGRDALMVIERHQGPIQLLVTDVVMPEMGGRELVESVQPAHPDLKVLYISGYTNDEIVRRGISEPDTAFIQKPFSSDEFVRRVRELLDANGAAAQESVGG